MIHPKQVTADADLIDSLARGRKATPYKYRDETGGHVLTSLRIDEPGRDKTFRLISRVADSDAWHAKDLPDTVLRPLYRLGDLGEAELVVIVEGEKCVAAARRLGLTATTSAGGCNSPHRSDWSPLSGKRVVMLPDFDGAGLKYMERVARELHALPTGPIEVRIVNLPALAQGEDVADWVARGGTLEQLERLISEAAPVDLEVYCGPEPEPTPPPRATLTQHRAGTNGRRPEAVERACAYARKIDPAVSGQRGHDQTFIAARAVLHRFELDQEEAFRVLWDNFNARCSPPWSERDLRRKVSEAAKAKRPPPSLLEEDHPTTQRTAAKENMSAADDVNCAVLNGVRRGPTSGDRAARDDDDKPTVQLPGDFKGTSVTVTQCAAELGDLMDAEERYFLRGGQVQIVTRDTQGAPILSSLKPASATSEFERVAVLTNNDGHLCTCTEANAKRILGASAFLRRLPRIRLLAPCPVLAERANGELAEVTSYDRELEIMVTGGAEVPRVSLEDATPLISELLADFRFASPGDRSRAIAAMITPALVAGGLLGGRAPIDFGEADESQAGKGFRNKLTAAIYRNRVYPVVQKRGGVGGLEESFSAILIAGRNFVTFDNMRGRIDSPALESFMTEPTYQARTPYAPIVEIETSRHVVMLTSNGVEMTDDLKNRISLVRIQKHPDGYEFREYPEGDLLDRVQAHQPRYLGAVFSLVRAWHCAGKPRTKAVGHDFRAWARTLDWIVQELLGEAPLLAGHRAAAERTASPFLVWLRGLLLIVRKNPSAASYLDKPLRAHDLLDLNLADPSIGVPGVRDDDDPDDEGVRDVALKAIGRSLARCFTKIGGDVIEMEGVRLTRRQSTDCSHRPIKTYRFALVEEEPR